MNFAPALSALSGGPSLTEGTLADLASPSREAVWRHLRAFRYEPPGRARRGARGEPGQRSLDQRWNRHSNCSQQPPSTTPLDRSSCFMASVRPGGRLQRALPREA
jgi:hypothetical protein